MKNTRLSRVDFLKGIALGGVGLLLSAGKVSASEKPAKGPELPANLHSFAGEPTVGQPGYEKRVARLFGATRATRY